MTDFDLDIPRAGAPLEIEIHPKNRAVLESDVAKRLEMARARLSRFQLWNVQREYSRLHRKLNKSGYNRLILERAELLEAFTALKAQYREKPTPARKKKLIEIQARSKAIDKALEKLQPVLADYLDVKQRLDAHEIILQLEREEKENQAAFFREAGVWEQQMYQVFDNYPKLHHITKDRNGNDRKTTPVFDHVFLKADKVYFRVRTSKQNLFQRFMGRWSSAIPYGVEIADLISENTLANLTAACGRVVTVERSPRSQNIFYVINRMDSADGIPKIVRFDQVLDHYPVNRHPATPWAAGVGEDRKVIHFDFEEYAHILIGGASGGGKSTLINGILAQLITMNSPDELRLILIDNKGGVELSHFEGIPHLLTPPVISVDKVLPALKSIRQIMNQRFEMFLKVKARSLISYNAKVKNPMPRLLIIIDEMASLLGIDETHEIHNELRVITSQGRATGVHMIVATQHPSVDVLPGWIKTNLNLRIASRMPNHTASQIIVDSITAAYLPENPGRMVIRRGGFEMILQTPLIEDDGIARAVKNASAYTPADWQMPAIREPDKAESDTDEFTPIIPMEEPVPKFGENDYLKIAVRIGCRLSAEKVHAVVGNDVISLRRLREIREQIVTRKTVTVHGIDYAIKREAKGHILVPIEHPMGQEANTEYDTPEDGSFDSSAETA